MAEKPNITLKFIIVSGNTARIVEVEAAVTTTAKIGSLLGAIREEFGEDMQLSANQELQMFVQVPSNATLEQFGVGDGDSILLITGSGGRLVTPLRKGK